MTEWKEYTGSGEQISELKNAKNYSLRLRSGTQILSKPNREHDVTDYCGGKEITQYLICNPHPLAEMICQQARTGQPVWIRQPSEFREGEWFYLDVTNTPDWYIPNAEYSFTEFKEEV